MYSCDYLIVGGGIAGASLAYELAPRGAVLMIEAEDIAGYHTTGRSAAMYLDFYGGQMVQPLTLASHDFFAAPPADISDVPLWYKEGCLQIARVDQLPLIRAARAEQQPFTPHLTDLDGHDVEAMVPFLKKEMVKAGLYDDQAKVLDVHSIHQAYLKGAKARGAQLLTKARLVDMHRDDGLWLAETRAGAVQARVVVNAAGAWADEVAALACAKQIGLTPKRRTIIIAEDERLNPPVHMPIVFDVAEELYFKREGQNLLICPCDEIDDVAGDAQPDPEDIAKAAWHFAKLTGFEPAKISRKWAGLRTFAPDRNPVIGFDHHAPNFFWSVGQGGYGIQTAPAWAQLAAALVQGQAVPTHIQAQMDARDVTLQDYDPSRFG